MVRRLTELYLQRNQVDRLLTRLQHQGRDDRPDQAQPQPRDVAICMAQAYATSGDLGSARAELERLLTANTRDTQLLKQLSKLAEEEGDYESAARYQQQLNDQAPSDEGSSRLAFLYSRSGGLEEAQAVWAKMAAGKGEAFRIYQAMDSLLNQKKPQPVLEATEAMVRKNPTDWEAVYRRGVSLAALDKPEEAAATFRALLNLNTSDDEKSAFARAWARNPGSQAAATSPYASTFTASARDVRTPLEERIGASYLIRLGCKLETSTSQRLWAPTDYGQARMAALGWLMSLAQRRGPRQADEVVTSFRAAASKTPADLHAVWDWFYLCLVRYDNAGVYSAARALTRAAPADPLALWVYLYSLGGRALPLGREYYVSQARDTEENIPPLDKDEMEYVLACYRSLRTRRPELAQALVLLNVSEELKRAKRFEEDVRFYREAVEGSTQMGQIVGVFDMAAQRGDVDSLIQLNERFERLQTGRTSAAYYTGTYSFRGPGLAMSRGISACADRRAYADMLRLVDYNLAAARQKTERQTPGAAARALRARYASLGRPGYTPIMQIWVGTSSRLVRLSFPQVNDYLDSTVIGVLRTAYELYKRDDLLSDLIDHFRRQAASARSSTDAIYPRLALSSLLWWGDQKEEAIAELTRVVASTRAGSDLRLDLAELMEQQRAYADALALVDEVQPLDNMVLKRREELALRLAGRSGDIERARQAAERLFGLRLDTDTQVWLAGQMHQLGQHELAEAVLGRARRRAGNKTSALVGLMVQYQNQNKVDVAVQIASQILHASTAIRPAVLLTRSDDEMESARTAAIGVLARSGRIPQLIDRANEQLKKTPNSMPLHQTLADYYAAAGRRDQARAELARVAELRPDDANLRLQVAQQLVQAGQAAAALDYFYCFPYNLNSFFSRGKTLRER